MKFKLYDYENDRSTDIELTPSQWKELQAFLKELKNPPTHDYKAVLDCFNRICSKLPPATRLTDKRKRAIIKAQKDGYDLEQVFRTAAQSAFLCGRNSRGWRAFVKSLAAAHMQSNPPLEGDYIDEDGLLRCGKCGGFKRSRIEVSGEEIIVPVWCECMTRAKEEEKKRSESILANMRANELRRLSLMDNSLSAVRFTTADKLGENARSVEICRRYAAKFPQMKQDNRGLLLFGGVGTGKTYTAACIANELLARGTPVVMTSLVKLIENGISDLCSRLSAIDLLILDDLGAERSTDYALEQVYNIVDSRYRAGLPVIYTTNLTLEELKNPADMRYARIYDRVLEKCFPVEFRGVSRRKHGARQGFDDMMALLGVDDTT